MVCLVCRNMLGCQDGKFANGTHDIRYNHHKTARTFQQAVQQNCYICRAVYGSLVVHLKNSISSPRRDSLVSTPHSSDERDILSGLAEQSFTSQALLFQEELDRTYRLEIRTKLDQINTHHTFHLECQRGSHESPDRKSVHIKYRSVGNDLAISPSLSEHSSYQSCSAVYQWLKTCKCYSISSRPFYPTRIISLENIKASMCITGTPTSRRRGTKMTVNLVETANWPKSHHRRAQPGEGERRYVTLSHCWGGEVSHRLLNTNYESYKQGILVEDLPKTFRDAVYFAASLEDVDYIWIDSLCIIQDNTTDWGKESTNMHRVYSNSFLNLSATAASSSHGGLFKSGEFQLLKEEEVAVHIEGLPRAYDRVTVPRCIHERGRFFTRRCKIVDSSFWDNRVDRGQVNTRGWVLQERLMSPRVIHFCHDQVGWECSCRHVSQTDIANGKHKPNTSGEHSRYSDIIEGIRQRLLNARPGAHTKLSTRYSPFDLWAAIVSAYTKTKLTMASDKLVALSGLARIVSEETNCAYVAGLWSSHLAYQLLWYVEPAFDQRDRSFSNPGTFGRTYRAPSFSWAAIDVTGHGITYAKVANQKLFVAVETAFVESLSRNSADNFGMISNAQITLHGKIRKARLMSVKNNRFSWHLMDREELDAELHTNNYIDCPLRDADCIDEQNAHVYILPVAEEITYSGTSKNVYLKCLILRATGERGTFKRVGITKLGQPMDRKALTKVETKGGETEYKILAALPGDASLPHAGYDKTTGMHRLHLV